MHEWDLSYRHTSFTKHSREMDKVFECKVGDPGSIHGPVSEYLGNIYFVGFVLLDENFVKKKAVENDQLQTDKLEKSRVANGARLIK